MTERLYYDDPWRARFEATVIAHRDHDGRPAVELDRTLFYPESGGQMADHGQIHHGDRSTAVTDVQLAEDRVMHVVAEPPPIGATIAGEIDSVRRRVHMALHTGQHILSRALADEAGAQTVSARLGETACTIDVDRDCIEEADLGRALDRANAVVDDDVEVEAVFPSDQELSALDLRREAKVEGPIRVVKVGDFDVTPCGGTHCTRSGQVGLIEITGFERRKRRLRLSFLAGPRARQQLAFEARMVRDLARSLSCAPEQVAEAYDKLRAQTKRAQDALERTEALLADRVAASLWAEATRPRVVASLEPLGPAVVREIAKRIVTEPEAVALLATRTEEGLHVVLARGAQSDFDCGALLKAAAAEAGGRGGGRPDRAEGRLPADTDWEALVGQL